LNRLEIIGPGFDGFDFAQGGFGGFGVVPEAGSGGLRFSSGYLFFAGIVVKDTSSGPRRGPSSP
jgi:hypothetical protein